MIKIMVLFLLSFAGVMQASTPMEQDNQESQTQRVCFYTVNNQQYTEQQQIADNVLQFFTVSQPQFFILRKKSIDAEVQTLSIKPGRLHNVRVAMQNNGPVFLNTYAVVDENVKNSMSNRDIYEHLVMQSLATSLQCLHEDDFDFFR